MNIAIVIDDNIKLKTNNYYRQLFLKITNHIIYHLKKKHKITIYFTNSPILILTQFEKNDSIENYINSTISNYTVNDGISNINNLDNYQLILALFNNDSHLNFNNYINYYNNIKLINISTINIQYENFRIINYKDYLETNANLTTTIKYDSLENFFVLNYIESIGFL